MITTTDFVSLLVFIVLIYVVKFESTIRNGQILLGTVDGYGLNFIKFEL